MHTWLRGNPKAGSPRPASDRDALLESAGLVVWGTS